MVVTYRVDGTDRLTAWNKGFADFGRENGLNVDDSLMGSSLWDHVHDGDELRTQRWLLRKARLGQDSIRYRYRCDSPDEYRLFEMEMRPTEGGDVELTSELLAMRPLQRGDEAGPDPLAVCAWCQRVSSPTGWIKLRNTTLDLDHGNPDVGVALTHGICARCSAELLVT